MYKMAFNAIYKDVYRYEQNGADSCVYETVTGIANMKAIIITTALIVCIASVVVGKYSY